MQTSQRPAFQIPPDGSSKGKKWNLGQEKRTGFVLLDRKVLLNPIGLVPWWAACQLEPAEFGLSMLLQIEREWQYFRLNGCVCLLCLPKCAKGWQALAALPFGHVSSFWWPKLAKTMATNLVTKDWLVPNFGLASAWYIWPFGWKSNMPYGCVWMNADVDRAKKTGCWQTKLLMFGCQLYLLMSWCVHRIHN